MTIVQTDDGWVVAWFALDREESVRLAVPTACKAR